MTNMMRYLPTLLAPILLLALAFTYSTGDGDLNPFVEEPVNSVQLPILVGGKDGDTESVTVNASNVSDVDTLMLWVHSPGYPSYQIEKRGYSVDKMSVRLNGGSWLGINNSTADCFFPEDRHKCITGPLPTQRFKVAISDLGTLQNGSNTIDFRFNYACEDGYPCDISTHYRVLHIALWNSDSENTDAIDGTDFYWDDPSGWEPPQGGDPNNGEQLWRQRNILHEAFGERKAIVASCGDCHAWNGYDLQYFAYSNEVIIERSEFHGLTEQQGKDIAAFIRSIDLRDSEGNTFDPPGRPWEPPYQPGPSALATREYGDDPNSGQGFEDIDQALWSAGAGLEWAYENDAQTFEHWFPDGNVNRDAINTYQNRLDLYEIPIALQMPDWNEWLPVHHPLDSRGDRFRNPPDNGGRCQNPRTSAWDYWQEEFNEIDGSTSYSRADNLFRIFGKRVDDFRACHGFYDNLNDANIDAGDANISIMQWGAVKMWEKAQTYSLNRPGSVHPNSSELAWPGKSRIPFNIAPHIVKQPNDTQESPKGQRNSCMRNYFDAAWYHMQPVVNAGKGIHTGIMPVDWKYHFMYIKVYEGQCGVDQAQRYFLSLMKLWQLAETTPNSEMSENPEGWYMRHTSPIWMFQRQQRDIERQPVWDLNRAADNAACHIATAMLEEFEARALQHDPDEWIRQTGRHGLEPESFDPTLSPDPLKYDNTTYANHFARLHSDWNELGIPASLQNDIADWSSDAWPNFNFHGQVDSGSSCGTLGSYSNSGRSYATLNTQGQNASTPGEPPEEPQEGDGHEFLISAMQDRIWGNADGASSSGEDYIEGVRVGPEGVNSAYVSVHDMDLTEHSVYYVPFDTIQPPKHGLRDYAFSGIHASTDSLSRGCQIRVSAYSERQPRGAIARRACRTEDGEDWEYGQYRYTRTPVCTRTTWTGTALETEVQSECTGPWQSLGEATLSMPDESIAVVGAVAKPLNIEDPEGRLRAYVGIMSLLP